MSDSSAGQINIKSTAIQCSEWTYEHIYMYYAFSPDGRIVFKWTFMSFLVVDTFYGKSRQFSSKEPKTSFRIRDFLPLTQFEGLLLYAHGQRTFISFIEFDFSSKYYELTDPTEIVDDCRGYGGNLTLKADDPSRGVAFLTRNYPGDIFVFFQLMDNDRKILVEQVIETDQREYCGFAYYAVDSVFFFRLAYGGGERPFEALKVLEKRENAKTQTIYFGPMPLMNRNDLMHRTQMPRFQGTWNSGVFYLSVNIDPHQYFISLNLQTLKWAEVKISSIQFDEPRIQIANKDEILIVHNESKMNGSANRTVNTYRIPMRCPESLKNLAFFHLSKNNNFKPIKLTFNCHVKPLFID